jgi:hypothetical protein
MEEKRFANSENEFFLRSDLFFEFNIPDPSVLHIKWLLDPTPQPSFQGASIG